MTTAIFIDTNVFLHYLSVDQIDWGKICGQPKVELVVCAAVVRELQKTKELHNKSHLRERSAKAIRQIKKYSTGELVRSNTTLRLYVDDPLIDFVEHRLNKDIYDDYLIATIIHFIQEESHHTVYLVTADDGLILTTKAHSRSINTLILDDALKLPPMKSAEEIKIEALQKKLAVHEMAGPQLFLTWRDGERSSTVALGKKQGLTKTVEDIKVNHPKLPESVPDDSPQRDSHLDEIRKLALSTFGSKTTLSKTNKEYNEELDAFYKQYDNYIKEIDLYLDQLARTVRISFVLHNTGGTPGKDMDVRIELPNQLRVYAIDGYPKSPSVPSPPKKPRSYLGGYDLLPIMPGYDLHNLIDLGVQRINPVQNVSYIEAKSWSP